MKHVQESLVSSLTTERLRGGIVPSDSQSNSVVGVRDLISQRRYGEAVQAYSNMIEAQPRSQTLYIGRAQAHFLAGNGTAALMDLDTAITLGASATSLSKIRDMIERGDVNEFLQRPRMSDKAAYTDRLRGAEEALAGGDGITAFELYENLEKDGYTRPFAVFGKSMSCALKEDYNGATGFLNDLKIIGSTPMAINITALKCIINCALDIDNSESAVDLVAAISQMPSFFFGSSPLRFFFAGLEKRKRLTAKAEGIRTLLERAILN